VPSAAIFQGMSGTNEQEEKCAQSQPDKDMLVARAAKEAGAGVVGSLFAATCTYVS